MIDARRPNILLLVLESTPASHLSCYGYGRLTTPYLDEFAEDGVLYEQAISAASWTLPSHASLFTGLHVSQHGAHFNHPHLTSDLVTLAELLQSRGWETAAFTTNDWVNEEFGFNRGFNTFRWSKRTLEWLNTLFPAETKLEKVIRYLRDPVYPVGNRNNRLLREWISKVKRQGQPFFAYTLYFDPHYPYRPQYPYARRFLKGTSRPWWRINLDPDRYMVGEAEMSDEDFEILGALYDSRLAGTDAILGRLLGWLRREGILDETLVIVVADHGENLGEHGLMSHQYCVYDTLVHVPLILRYPPLFKAGQRVTDLVQSLEIFTTILDILDIDRSEIPNDVRGRSLLPEKLAGEPLPFAISEYLVPNLKRMKRLYGDAAISRYDRSLRAIRQNHMKAILSSDSRSELYDLTLDPGETQNLADQRPELVQELRAKLDDWLASINVAPSVSASDEDETMIDEKIMMRLRDLGYL